MCKKCLRRPVVAGLIQAVGVFVYILLVALFMNFMDGLDGPDSPLNIIMVLMLFVFSAAVTGSLIFAYPAYLVIKKDTEKALKVFGYTLLYMMLIFIVTYFLFFMYHYNL